MNIRHGLAALIASMIFTGSVSAQGAPSATAQANRLAYDYAMMCFVANGVAVGDWREAGDTQRQAAQEAKARQSFDTAVKLGAALGFSGSRVNQDFGLAQSRELPKMVTDSAYFRQSVATCKTLGLM